MTNEQLAKNISDAIMSEINNRKLVIVPEASEFLGDDPLADKVLWAKIDPDLWYSLATNAKIETMVGQHLEKENILAAVFYVNDGALRNHVMLNLVMSE